MRVFDEKTENFTAKKKKGKITISLARRTLSKSPADEARAISIRESKKITSNRSYFLKLLMSDIEILNAIYGFFQSWLRLNIDNLFLVNP